MSMVTAILSLVRRRNDSQPPARSRGHGPSRSPAPSTVVRVRECYVCGGDPRHLCCRCREVIQ